jgi:hypothetical protein
MLLFYYDNPKLIFIPIMWNTVTLESNQNSLSFRLQKKDTLMSHRQFLSQLSENDSFADWYNQLLTDCPFDAFLWENKPVTLQNIDETYECTIVKSSQLSRVSPDSTTFDAYFSPDSDTVTFPNLGGDAQLVVPCPVADRSVYTHIGRFVRGAPDHQIKDFWTRVGKEMLDHIQQEPRWLSTSGLGVYWLHIRIDSVPKYYQTEAYKRL